jgi:selenocysteine lyase/cysteine desulfurase
MALVARSLGLEAEDNVIFCDREEPASVAAWLDLHSSGVEVKMIPSLNGGLTLEELKQVANARTRVVAASAFQAFTGHRTDLAGIGKFCRERQILFVVDASQAIGHTSIDVQKMEIDLLVTGGGRSLMALAGSGFLYCREAVARQLKSHAAAPESLHYPDDASMMSTVAGNVLTGRPDRVAVAGMSESMGLIKALTRDAIDRHTTGLAAHALETAKQRGYELTTVPGEHGSIATFRSKFDPAITTAYARKMREEGHVVVGAHRDRSDHAFIRLSFHCYNEEAEIARAFDALDKMK